MLTPLGPAPGPVPRRIVSLVPSQTELLADLGLDEEVVGITRFCVHPANWKGRKRIVGGTKNANIERIRELEPDLVIANLEENERQDVEAIAEFAPVMMSDVESVDGALGMIRAVGDLVCRAERAANLADEIEAAFDSLRPVSPLKTAYLIWRDPWMTVGGDTYISDVMTRSGLVNVFGEGRRYPTTSLAELGRIKPDVVLLSSEPFPFKDEHVAEVAQAAPDSRVVLVDGEMFSWYGSRMRLTPPYLKTLLAAF